ncbi:hypothetical protein HELRODRAFT_165924 [Helobdella robusta]|uniref:Uncharacterized protein n=1 Tax=Helobdella robusta TaxID=6412 RepID=T1EXG8_HELRO|nr:hypothetical protein HELRODRAFT_165924 [Helobdella robusta]ESN90281.1 hypothetical protein HELRODRAFT_165924 [Helobdella robusta]
MFTAQFLMSSCFFTLKFTNHEDLVTFRKNEKCGEDLKVLNALDNFVEVDLEGKVAVQHSRHFDLSSHLLLQYAPPVDLHCDITLLNSSAMKLTRVWSSLVNNYI